MAVGLLLPGCSAHLPGPPPSSACETAFQYAASLDSLHDTDAQLFPALTACATILDFNDASAKYPAALDGTPPLTWLHNVCSFHRKLRVAPICGQMADIDRVQPSQPSPATEQAPTTVPGGGVDPAVAHVYTDLQGLLQGASSGALNDAGAKAVIEPWGSLAFRSNGNLSGDAHLIYDDLFLSPPTPDSVFVQDINRMKRDCEHAGFAEA